MKRLVAFLVDLAPSWLWKPGNLRFIGSRTVHFCYGEGHRTIEIGDSMVLEGRRVRHVTLPHAD